MNQDGKLFIRTRRCVEHLANYQLLILLLDHQRDEQELFKKLEGKNSTVNNLIIDIFQDRLNNTCHTKIRAFSTINWNDNSSKNEKLKQELIKQISWSPKGKF